MGQCLYADCNDGIHIVRAGRSRTLEHVLAGGKSAVAYIRTFGFKVWVGVSDKVRRALERKLVPESYIEV